MPWDESDKGEENANREKLTARETPYLCEFVGVRHNIASKNQKYDSWSIYEFHEVATGAEAAWFVGFDEGNEPAKGQGWKWARLRQALGLPSPDYPSRDYLDVGVGQKVLVTVGEWQGRPSVDDLTLYADEEEAAADTPF